MIDKEAKKMQVICTKDNLDDDDKLILKYVDELQEMTRIFKKMHNTNHMDMRFTVEGILNFYLNELCFIAMRLTNQGKKEFIKDMESSFCSGLKLKIEELKKYLPKRFYP